MSTATGPRASHATSGQGTVRCCKRVGGAGEELRSGELKVSVLLLASLRTCTESECGCWNMSSWSPGFVCESCLLQAGAVSGIRARCCRLTWAPFPVCKYSQPCFACQRSGCFAWIESPALVHAGSANHGSTIYPLNTSINFLYRSTGRPSQPLVSTYACTEHKT